MPAFVPVVLTDDETTPVAHTFNPAGKPGEVVVWTEKDASGVPLGANTLSFSNRHGVREKTTARLKLPTVVVETINGVQSPTIIHTAHLGATFDFSEKSTEQQRANAVAMFASALQPGGAFFNAIVQRDDYY